MQALAVIATHSGLDTSLLQGKSSPTIPLPPLVTCPNSSVLNLFIYPASVERGTVRLKRLVQEHNTVMLAKAHAWIVCECIALILIKPQRYQ